MDLKHAMQKKQTLSSLTIFILLSNKRVVSLSPVYMAVLALYEFEYGLSSTVSFIAAVKTKARTVIVLYGARDI